MEGLVVAVRGAYWPLRGCIENRTPVLIEEWKGNDPNHFIGMDVSLASSAICVIDMLGNSVRGAKVSSEPEVLSAFIRNLPFGIAVGLEAGPLLQWLSKPLAGAGVPVLLMEARQVRSALKAMPVKTDRRDADGMVSTRALQVGLG